MTREQEEQPIKPGDAVVWTEDVTKRGQVKAIPGVCGWRYAEVDWQGEPGPRYVRVTSLTKTKKRSR